MLDGSIIGAIVSIGTMMACGFVVLIIRAIVSRWGSVED